MSVDIVMPALLSLMMMIAVKADGNRMPNVSKFGGMGYYDGAVFIKRFSFRYVVTNLLRLVKVAIVPMRLYAR